MIEKLSPAVRSSAILDIFSPFRSSADIVDSPDLPDHDGRIHVYKAGRGFWGKECSECGLTLVNGTRTDGTASEEELLASPIETFSVVPDSKFTVGVQRDGTTVVDFLHTCPDCDATLVVESSAEAGVGANP